MATPKPKPPACRFGGTSANIALSQKPPCSGSQDGWQGTAPRFSKPCSASVWGQAAHHGHDQSHGLVCNADICLMSWPCTRAQLAGCQQLQQELCFLQSSPDSFVTAWLCHSWQHRNFLWMLFPVRSILCYFGGQDTKGQPDLPPDGWALTELPIGSPTHAYETSPHATGHRRLMKHRADTKASSPLCASSLPLRAPSGLLLRPAGSTSPDQTHSTPPNL